MSVIDSRWQLGDVGLGYTLATGRLFCDFTDFHAFAENILGHPIFTHEFADEQTWTDLRAAFEVRLLEGVPSQAIATKLRETQ